MNSILSAIGSLTIVAVLVYIIAKVNDLLDSREQNNTSCVLDCGDDD